MLQRLLMALIVLIKCRIAADEVPDSANKVPDTADEVPDTANKVPDNEQERTDL